MWKSVLVCLVSVAAFSANAQSSLGLTGADLRLGVAQDEAGTEQPTLALSGDFAITDHHGFQGDVAFSDTDSGVIGSLGAHLYLAPVDGRKYGFFANFSDVDGRSAAWGDLGVEGMFSIGERSSAEVRAGLGKVDGGSLDYVFGSVGLAHDLSDAMTVTAALDLAEFDEAEFRALGYEIGLGIEYSRPGSPWGAFAGVTRSGLSGRDGAPGETRVELGLSVQFGSSGGAMPSNRLFRRSDVIAPLVRRGLQ